MHLQYQFQQIFNSNSYQINLNVKTYIKCIANLNARRSKSSIIDLLFLLRSQKVIWTRTNSYWNKDPATDISWLENLSKHDEIPWWRTDLLLYSHHIQSNPNAMDCFSLLHQVPVGISLTLWVFCTSTYGHSIVCNIYSCWSICYKRTIAGHSVFMKCSGIPPAIDAASFSRMC